MVNRGTMGYNSITESQLDRLKSEAEAKIHNTDNCVDPSYEPVAEESNFNKHITRIDNALNILWKSVDNIELRFAPILRSPYPEPCDDSKKPESTSHFEQFIEDVYSRIIATSDTLKNICERSSI